MNDSMSSRKRVIGAPPQVSAEEQALTEIAKEVCFAWLSLFAVLVRQNRRTTN